MHASTLQRGSKEAKQAIKKDKDKREKKKELRKRELRRRGKNSSTTEDIAKNHG